jgi:hypothetical protein
MGKLGLSVLCACALLAVCASSASAQLVFGSTTTTTSNPCAMYLDVDSGVVTTLWNSASNKKVNGMAADLANSRLYTNDAARINYWDFGSIGITPTFIAGTYRWNGTAWAAFGCDGLAFANGQLYGSTSYPSTLNTRGIYQIPTVPVGGGLQTTQIWSDPTATPGTSGLLSLGGIEFNSADGLFYVTNTVDTTGSGYSYTPGLYSIDAFGTGAMTRVADFPDGRTKIDGLAIGGGKYWLTEQEPANNRIDIYPYDPSTGTYGDTIYFTLTDSTQRATGAAWAPGAPEPATLCLLALGTLAILRRR